MSIQTTTPIKGVFAVIILLSHSTNYITLGTGFPDSAFSYFLRFVGQLMVAVYFFYSGYGICESIKTKKDYVQGFFHKRFLKTLLHFDLAVLLFLILQTILGNHFETKNYFLCWIGWKDLGNSAWFIFVMLSLYLATYLVLLAKHHFRQTSTFMAIAVSLASFGIWFALRSAKPGEYWWYDTVLVFPAGMWFSVLKERIEVEALKPRLLLTILAVIVFLSWRHYIGIDDFGLCAICFVLSITSITTFVKIDNKLLQWLGKHCFSLYMLQRLPMLVLCKTPLVKCPILFTAAVLVCLIPLAFLFDKATEKMTHVCFTNKHADETFRIRYHCHIQF